jgi:hypothetical protein
MTDLQTNTIGRNSAAATPTRGRLVARDADGLRYSAPFRMRRRMVVPR